MDSMEKWLGFSLSHQEIPNNNTARTVYTKSEIEEEDCFHFITNHSSSPHPHDDDGIDINHFNTSNPIPSSQDWNNYKNNSDMSSMILSVGASNSCNNNNINMNQNSGIHHQVKLEDLLGGVGGGYSHGIQGYNNILHGGGGGAGAGGVGGDGVIENINNTTIGLSMINNWLRRKTSSEKVEKNNELNVVGTNAQSLSLSMSTGEGEEGGGGVPTTTVAVAALPLMTASSEGGESSTTESNGMRVDSQSGVIEAPPTKPVQTFGQRTSIYRGVTRHRWTGRYEAHLWDNSCRREGQTRKGRQVYLGGYDKEERAARSYDLAALKYWGTATTTNFPFSDYVKELEVMKNMTRQEYVASLRRKSSGFSRGASIYRGVTRHHQHGRWQARIGRVAGNKDLYLGTFSTQEEAAEAYDVAAIKFRGLNAVTNFEINRYDVNSILESSTLQIGGSSKRLKEANDLALQVRAIDETESLNNRVAAASGVWPSLAFPVQAQPLVSMYPYNTQQMPKQQQQQQQLWCKQEFDSSDHVNHSFQDVHFGNAAVAAHNFFQPSHVLHNLMSLDSSSFEHLHNTPANAATSPYQSVGYGINNGYGMPIAEETVTNQVTSYENMFGSSDPYQTRNMYYHSQQQHGSNEMIPKASVYDQGSSCDNWMTNGLPTDDCHEASTFTVWNDA